MKGKVRRDMELFYIIDDDECGEDRSLLVRAPREDDAVKFWRRFYRLNEDDKPTRILPIKADLTKPGPISWRDGMETT